MFFLLTADGMDFSKLIVALTPTRVAILDRLIEEGATPMGVLAARVCLAPSSLTPHIRHLAEAGLARTWRDGKIIWAAANCRGVQVVVDWLDSPTEPDSHDDQ